ncbi:hypothetical protein [Streptomyces sp. NBC_00932]|uniref:hypothetical protein n=1 Tax=Streptomyces sp. NBC_00932 TaxID=2903690 RepID=UPI0038660ACC|nr:hypothetical protein OG221_27760 [Streptomyces sp. NBC_00932]
MFGRKSSPAAQEYRAAKKALAADPVNTGKAGRNVDPDSPAGRKNAAAQDRVRAAERKLRG